MIAQTCLRRRIFKTPSLGMAFCAAFLCLTPQAHSQQSDLDVLAGETAAAITTNVKYMNGSARVLVPDFLPPQHAPGELGTKLADQFADALSRHASGFAVVDRGDYLEKFGKEMISASTYESDDAGGCYLGELRADTLPSKAFTIRCREILFLFGFVFSRITKRFSIRELGWRLPRSCWKLIRIRCLG